MYSLVSCGSVISRPSSLIKLYSISLLVLALFLACHIMFGSFFSSVNDILYSRICSLLFLFLYCIPVVFLAFDVFV